jgi:hypothetical protein
MPALGTHAAKNQPTLPQAVVEAVGRLTSCAVAAENGRTVLTPARIGRADALRAKLAERGSDERDRTAARGWARRRA